MLVATGSSPARAATPLSTAFATYGVPSGREATYAFARMRAGGATHVHIPLNWAAAAPNRLEGDATDPANPGYRWSVWDGHVRLALAYGLQPIIMIAGAPQWAQGTPHGAVRPDPVNRDYRGAFRPDPAEFARFAKAAARRYSGSFGGLPRVRYWQAWGEPNVSGSMTPQLIGNKPASPAWYRGMLNAFAASVHSVHRDNSVIAGGLSPFTVRNSSSVAIGPLRFMRELLCVSKGTRPRSTCKARARFDIWSHHPYTSGGPTRHAFREDDVSLGDLPEMRRLLHTAVRLRKVETRQRVRFWVTEFSWDSRPPDPHPRAVPIRLHARWVAEALYRMWQSGVSLVTWFLLRDEAYPASPLQSGLYFYAGPSFNVGQAKPALSAFRFPFVAFKQRGGARIWGRTPAGRPGVVLVEQRLKSGWRRLATVRANSVGIFSRVVRIPKARSATRPNPRIALSDAYRSAVLADSPTFFWRLGERSGVTARDERGSRSGTYLGGVKLGVSGALRSDSDRAIALDGRNDRVDLGPIGSPRAVELWLKTTSTRGTAAFSNRNAISHYSFLGIEGSGYALAFDTLGLLGTRWISDGRWHHLVYTYTAGGLGRLYLDGSLDATSTWSRMEGGAPASLGYDSTLRSYLKGSLDEVAVYDYPLSERQVKQHYAASGQKPNASSPFPVSADGSYLRARLASGAASSVPFSLKRPPDRYVLPFGG